MAARDPRPSSDQPDRSAGPRPAKADWRRPGPGSARPTPPDKKKEAAWQVKPDRSYEDAKRWYRVRVAGWTLFSIGLVVAFILAVVYWPRRTPLVALAILDYHGALSLAVPPNAWAQEDLERFQLLDTREEIVRFIPATCLSSRKGVEAFSRLREEVLRVPGGRGRSVIVYLSGHGVVNQQGDPCLLVPGDSPLSTDSWVPLQQLLEYLFPSEAHETLPGNKLLILDCNRIDANWRLGILYNSFADRLEEAVRKASIPGLAILNSTGPGEIGWTSPEQLRGSVFGYFVAQALRGAADRREEGGNANGRVSLQELYRYVRAHVRQWVLETRADLQQPLLVPANAEIDSLVHAKSTAPTEVPAVREDVHVRWASDLDSLWLKHEELRASAPWRIHPLGWETFQQGLLRLEQLAMAGSAYDEEYARLREDLTNQAEALADQHLPDELVLHSLPLRLQVGREARWHKKISKEVDSLAAQWSAPQRGVETAGSGDTSYLAAAAAAWQQCTRGLDPARWPELLRWLGARSPRAKLGGEPVEIHFLRMLAAHVDPATEKEHPRLLQRALAVRELAERAAAPADERAFWWIQAAVDQADASRRQAEDLLFVGTPDAIRQADAAFQTLGSPEGQAGAYAKAIAQAEEVSRAFALRDRVWAEAPYYAQWLLARLRPENAAQRQDLDALIQGVHELGAELDRAIGAAERSATWQKPYQALREAYDRLAKEYQEECTRLWERAPLNRRTLREISVVLSVPLASGKQRNGLWANYWQIARGHEAPPTEPTGIAQSAGSAGPAEPAAAATQPKTELHRVAPLAEPVTAETYLRRFPGRHPILAILDRSRLGVEEPACLRAASLAAKPPATDDSATWIDRLTQQGQCVRDLLVGPEQSVVHQSTEWLKQSQQRLEAGDRAAAEVREGRSKADRLVRAAVPLLDLARLPWPQPDTDPAHLLRRFDLHVMLVWHALRALEDFWGPVPESPDSPPFFAVAAGDYLRAAELLCPGVRRFRSAGTDVVERLAARNKAAKALLDLQPTDLSIQKADPQAPRSQELLSLGEVRARLARDLPTGTAALFLRDPAAASPLERTLSLFIAREGGQAEQRRVGVPVGSEGGEFVQPYRLRSRDPRLEHARLEAVALYRGHVVNAPFAATPPDYELVFVPPRYPPPTVTVFGEGVQAPCPVMFVLDYSGSMMKPVPILSPDGKTVETPRYLIARNALSEVLDGLSKKEDRYLVGLRVFGHRLGWDFDRKKMVVWDPQNPARTKEKDPDFVPRVPREDVELLVPLGPFRPADAERLKQQLGRLQPLGETPIYLAIRQALGDLPPAQSPMAHGPQRHIVVVTDGVEETFDDDLHLLPSNPLPIEEALRNPAYRDVRLDIVGFRITPEDFEDQVQHIQNPTRRQEVLDDLLKRFEDLKRLAAQTGDPVRGKGAFYPANDPASLLRALERSLESRPMHYVVQRAKDRQPVSGSPAALNQPTTVSQASNVRVPYLVQVNHPEGPVTAEVELEGGEAIELFLSTDGSRLEHRRYTKNLSRWAKPAIVPDPTDPENPAKRFFVAPHIPDWKDTAVQFWISIQNGDPSRFSRRPEEAWVEIRPLVPDASEVPVYEFYDLAFQPGLPVPVLVCTAPDWPAKAEEAEIQLWFKMKKTLPDPNHVLTVAEFRKRGRFRSEAIPGREYTIDAKPGQQGAPYQVIVTERCAAGSRPAAARVEMEPQPERITRQYNRKAGTVHHTFYFDAAAAAQVEQFKVCLTPHGQIAERAVSLPEPFRVGIARRTR